MGVACWTGDVESLDRRGQAQRIGRDKTIANHQSASGYEGQKHLHGGNIEGDGRDREQAIERGEAGFAHRGMQKVGQRTMRDHHSLGFTRRAGSVDDVREMVRGKTTRPVIKDNGGLRDIVDIHQGNCVAAAGRKRSVHDQGGRPAFFQNGHQALARFMRIEWYITGSGFEDCKEGHGELGGSLHAYRDGTAGAGAQACSCRAIASLRSCSCR